MDKKTVERQMRKTAEAFSSAGIIITEEEKKNIEVADFGLNQIDEIGLQILTYVNTEKVCAKEMVLFPFQTCPEHKHVSGTENGIPFDGKEETFRVRKGVCYLYVSGEGSKEKIQANLPPTDVSVFREIVLHEGEQFTIFPNTLHWFQAGKDGAIISEFSTKSRDESDIFTDKRIIRIPLIEE